MLSIYICEDNPAERKLLETFVSDYLLFHSDGMKPQVHSFDNPKQLLGALRNCDTFGIYLLDIDLGHGQNGVETARQIRHFDPRGFILFITTHEECIPLTFQFQVEALDYIIKDKGDLRERIYNALDLSFRRYEAFQNAGKSYRPHQLKIKIGSCQHLINEKKIICISPAEKQHRLNLYTANELTTFYGSLDDLEKDLDSDVFFRCHRSAIISLPHVSSLDSTARQVILDNGMVFPVSPYKLEQLKKKLRIRK